MENLNWYEIVGYAASVVTAISLTMSSIVKLRWYNLLGSVCFAFYGLLIDALPVALFNFFIAGVNIWFLWKIYSEKDHFRILYTSIHDQYLKEFIELNKKDITKFFPSFKLGDNENIAIMIHRNLSLAGILIAHKTDDETLQIDLDFVLPQYRDLKAGNFLFNENRSFFTQQGITTIVTKAGNREHSKYLKRIGFVRDGELFALRF